mmetsp:Transcript_15356/g.25373  ORF Transcript_15356/g.25373 Transcript_15356/m.25373 type:complete len:514 (+) Transcript_15356:24-1565(+)
MLSFLQCTALLPTKSNAFSRSMFHGSLIRSRRKPCKAPAFKYRSFNLSAELDVPAEIDVSVFEAGAGLALTQPATLQLVQELSFDAAPDDTLFLGRNRKLKDESWSSIPYDAGAGQGGNLEGTDSEESDKKYQYEALACLKNGELQKAKEAVFNMAASCPPPRFLLRRLVDRLCEASLVDDAREVIQLMITAGLAPDLETYEWILRYLIREDYTSEGVELWHTILSNDKFTPQQINSIAVIFFQEVGETFEYPAAVQVMKSLKERSVVVEERTLVAYAHTLIDSGFIDGALDILYDLRREKDVSVRAVNALAKSIIIGQIGKREVRPALQLVESLERSFGIKPDDVLLTYVLAGSEVTGDEETEQRIREILFNMGTAPVGAILEKKKRLVSSSSNLVVNRRRPPLPPLPPSPLPPGSFGRRPQRDSSREGGFRGGRSSNMQGGPRDRESRGPSPRRDGRPQSPSRGRDEEEQLSSPSWRAFTKSREESADSSAGSSGSSGGQDMADLLKMMGM